MTTPRLTKSNRDILERLAAGWRPLKAQLPSGMNLERRRLIRLDWGPENSPDADRMCWYLTAKAREALAKVSAN